MRSSRLLFPTLCLMTLACCTRPALQTREKAMRVTSAPHLADDLPLETLFAAVTQDIEFLEKGSQDKASKDGFLGFGELKVSIPDYIRGLKRFLELGRTSGKIEDFFTAVAKEFEFLEVYGQDQWGQVFLTSYFEPQIQGSMRPTAKFSQPLYRVPRDMLELDLARFDPKFSGERKFRARMDGRRLLPYFNREEIDSGRSLKGRGLEICWVDALDAFLLQIQGSGTVTVSENGSSRVLHLNYADKNGQPYEPVGKFLRDRIPKEKLNLATIEALLRQLPQDEMQGYLNRNPSYVFFQTLDRSALTFSGVPATDGRTIATDRRFFPKGALAFLSFDRPKFKTPESLVPESSEPASRFVLDQDIGGAITGGGRVDLFWGRGPEAKRVAGAMKSQGRLFYLIPKG